MTPLNFWHIRNVLEEERGMKVQKGLKWFKINFFLFCPNNISNLSSLRFSSEAPFSAMMRNSFAVQFMPTFLLAPPQLLLDSVASKVDL